MVQVSEDYPRGMVLESADPRWRAIGTGPGLANCKTH
jgi:hypothetical protein